jgi:hypothetical protein
VPSSKYLGVTLQCDGKFDAHVNNITTKANQTLGFLRRNLKIGSIHAKSLAYKALVRPLLEYASTVWDPGTKKEITKLEKVQRRAARFTLHRYHNTSSVDEMLHHLQWPTLEDRRKKARLSMMFKITNSLASVTSPDLIPQRTKHARRGHERCYRQVTCRTDIRQHSFIPRTIKDWNNLPRQTVLAPSLDAFLSRVSSAL